MDLPPGIFTRSPREIAEGLKQSALASSRTKGTKFQSAMSMLNFFINRAGRNLPAADRARLEQAKAELREVFGKARPRTPAAGRRRRGPRSALRRRLARRAREARALPRTFIEERPGGPP